MKIIYNRFIPFKGFVAINLFGVLFVREGYEGSVNNRLITHETIHTKQMKEMLYVGFYVWYVVEWLIRLCYLWDTHKAYKRISFEVEANAHENILDYPTKRTPFRWLEYL